MTNFEKVKEFHLAFDLPVMDTPRVPDWELYSLRLKLINEEYEEVAWELENRAAIYLDKVAKELADLLYVTYGTAAAFGIDIDKAFQVVHESNMSKLGEDGKPIYREDGKVLKGPNYKAPDMSQFAS